MGSSSCSCCCSYLSFWNFGCWCFCCFCCCCCCCWKQQYNSRETKGATDIIKGQSNKDQTYSAKKRRKHTSKEMQKTDKNKTKQNEKISRTTNNINCQDKQPQYNPIDLKRFTRSNCSNTFYKRFEKIWYFNHFAGLCRIVGEGINTYKARARSVEWSGLFWMLPHGEKHSQLCIFLTPVLSSLSWLKTCENTKTSEYIHINSIFMYKDVPWNLMPNDSCG